MLFQTLFSEKILNFHNRRSKKSFCPPGFQLFAGLPKKLSKSLKLPQNFFRRASRGGNLPELLVLVQKKSSPEKDFQESESPIVKKPFFKKRENRENV